MSLWRCWQGSQFYACSRKYNVFIISLRAHLEYLSPGLYTPPTNILAAAVTNWANQYCSVMLRVLYGIPFHLTHVDIVALLIIGKMPSRKYCKMYHSFRIQSVGTVRSEMLQNIYIQYNYLSL